MRQDLLSEIADYIAALDAGVGKIPAPDVRTLPDYAETWQADSEGRITDHGVITSYVVENLLSLRDMAIPALQKIAQGKTAKQCQQLARVALFGATVSSAER